jgi:hypothetical protein
MKTFSARISTDAKLATIDVDAETPEQLVADHSFRFLGIDRAATNPAVDIASKHSSRPRTSRRCRSRKAERKQKLSAKDATLARRRPASKGPSHPWHL